MKWVQEAGEGRLAVKSWCAELEPQTMEQVDELARHPALCGHVALMPDCHLGKGMPIGGVVAARNAVIPSAVGVDIGCGMVAVETDLPVERLAELSVRRALQNRLKERIPVGEGHAHSEEQTWEGFERYLDCDEEVPQGFPSRLDRRNLGTLGGGNHFVELQQSEAGFVWLMIHSGSRNLGQRVEDYYARLARKLNEQMGVQLPGQSLAFLPLDEPAGQDYLRDMEFALAYALENRWRMMMAFKETLLEFAPEAKFVQETNIHHNYAAKEIHFGEEVVVHRKGATSARLGEVGIIPGSMGTPSYIVRGLGNPESYQSCSHGAGRVMSRTQACQQLTVEACDAALEGVVYERWSKYKGFGRSAKRGLLDLSEAPQAYKDIEDVIASELDLIEPLVKLRPLAVLKG